MKLSPKDYHNLINSNYTVINPNEPSISPNDAITNSFTHENLLRRILQPIIIFILCIFLVIQLIYFNNLYKEAIEILLNLKRVDSELASYYFNMYSEILKCLKIFNATVLGEFIAMFFVIINWGFKTNTNDLLKHIINDK